jgi:hypothetical protein
VPSWMAVTFASPNSCAAAPQINTKQDLIVTSSHPY